MKKKQVSTGIVAPILVATFANEPLSSHSYAYARACLHLLRGDAIFVLQDWEVRFEEIKGLITAE